LRIRKKFVYLLLVLAICYILNLLITPWYNYDFKKAYPGEKISQKLNLTKLQKIYACVGAPIIEEILFRGTLLFLALIFIPIFDIPKKKKDIIVFLLILVTGIAFGLIHYSNGGVYHFPSALTLLSLHGILFGWLAIKTKSLVYPILAHSLINVYAIFIGK